jgi:hypothetical protein
MSRGSKLEYVLPLVLALMLMLMLVAAAVDFGVPHRTTFEQRWSPIYMIDVGMKKDDRFDRKPTPKPQQRQPTMVPMRTRVAACTSFCEFP